MRNWRASRRLFPAPARPAAPYNRGTTITVPGMPLSPLIVHPARLFRVALGAGFWALGIATPLQAAPREPMGIDPEMVQIQEMTVRLTRINDKLQIFAKNLTQLPDCKPTVVGAVALEQATLPLVKSDNTLKDAPSTKVGDPTKATPNSSPSSPGAKATEPPAKPPENKLAETKPPETKPAETKPAEIKPPETKPAEPVKTPDTTTPATQGAKTDPQTASNATTPTNKGPNDEKTQKKPVRVQNPPPPPDNGLPLVPMAGGALAIIVMIILMIALKKRFRPSAPAGAGAERLDAEALVAQERARNEENKQKKSELNAEGGEKPVFNPAMRSPEDDPPPLSGDHQPSSADPEPAQSLPAHAEMPAPTPAARPSPEPSMPLPHRPSAVAIARPAIKAPTDFNPAELQAEALPALTVPDLPPVEEGGGGAPHIPEADQALELAEVMISMGLAKGAAETLVEHIRSNPKKALYHWLKLLDIYRKTGNKEEFMNSANDLRRYFNVQVDESQFIDTSHTMENYPHLMAKIQELWSQPQACVDFLARLLEDNRGGTRQGFPKMVAEEILLMIAVLRDEQS
jgi:hypothetical protein